VPIYAVGGIILNDVPEIKNTGIYGVAISSEITAHSNQKELIQNLNLLLYE
jgi:thiamine-phosphate pyrophosphorylase